MKHNLTDLNDHLFAQLERLADKTLSAEQLETEVKRTEAIVQVADKIVDSNRLGVQAAKIIADHGDRFIKIIPMISETDPVSHSASPRPLIKAAGT